MERGAYFHSRVFFKMLRPARDLLLLLIIIIIIIIAPILHLRSPLPPSHSSSNLFSTSFHNLPALARSHARSNP